MIAEASRPILVVLRTNLQAMQGGQARNSQNGIVLPRIPLSRLAINS